MADEIVLKQDEMANALSDNVRDTELEKYLIFSSGGILYGVSADDVREILTNTTITWLPMVPNYVSGVYNLRGQIVTILDFRSLLGQIPGDSYCTIMLDIADTQIGIMVDSVEQITDIEKTSILPVPSQQENKMVVGMCTVPGGTKTAMILDCARLLHD